MIAVVVRHAKVDLKWSFFQTSAMYERKNEEYDRAPVLPVTVRLPGADFKRVYISALPRTGATARQVLGRQRMTRTALINEVPGRAAFDSELRLPGVVWEAMGRTQWFFNVRRQPETRRETAHRAERFVKRLLRRDEDCIVFSHGFFMITLIHVMKKHGFVPDHTRLNYRNGECVVLIKKDAGSGRH